MTLTDGERDTLSAMDDHGLAEMWDTYEAAQARAKAGRDYVEYLFLRRMEEREADRIASPVLEIALTRLYDVDANALGVLGEHLDPAQIAAAYTPPEQIWTEAKWNMVMVNTWRRLGKEIADIIEDAKVYKPARVRVKRKALKT